MKKGKYYIGDLCYLFEGNAWSEFLKVAFDNVNKVFEYKGFPFFWAYTSYGDGEYNDSNGISHCVDSGSLGIVSAEWIDKYGAQDVEDAKKEVVFIPMDFEPYEEKGIFYFGDISINTNEDDEEEYFAEEEPFEGEFDWFDNE